jgi:anthranilate phosphoribosyltransferase
MSIAEYIFDNADSKPDLVKKELANLFIDIDTMTDFYSYLKGKMLSFFVESEKQIFDLCGTGGSGLSKVNMSTILAITLARKGYVIAKHANRASSGKVGSIDIIEKMGLAISNNSDEAKVSIKNNGYCFLFAPSFHPELRKISQIRKEIGKPTIINFIMPLLNPISNLSGQVIGVSSYNIMRLMSQLALKNGRNVLFVHDKTSGLDDVSILGETAIIEVRNGIMSEYLISPENFDMQKVSSFNEISGCENAEDNMKLALDIMSNSASKPYIDFLKINQIMCEDFFNSL